MTKTITAMLRESARHEDFWQQWLISDFTEELARRMDVLRMSRTAFAEKIGSTPPYVTRVLRGEENLTAATMSKLARAVGSVVRAHLAPLGTYSVWLDLSDSDRGRGAPGRPRHDRRGAVAGSRRPPRRARRVVAGMRRPRPRLTRAAVPPTDEARRQARMAASTPTRLEGRRPRHP